ncbi:sulfatase [Akkermansiaceae bacterium]|nr:sulfatase [Akkermansiaceae bacterium]
MTRLLLLFAILLQTPASATEKPNILFFFVDDMGWQDTSVPFHSEKTQLNNDYRTPNMERLAADGIKFTNAYACAICSPSRVSLMTGMHAARHKVTCWTLRKNVSPERKHPRFKKNDWNLNGLQPVGAGIEHTIESETLPGLLRKAGYRTIHAGKAHFGAQNTPGADPSNLGFDVNIAGSYMGGPGSYHGDHNFSAEWRGGGKIWDVPRLEKYHGQKINLTEAITRESIAAVEQAVEDKKPFYLYLSHYAVHAPFEPDRRFLPNYANKDWPKHKKVYASMIESMDHSLGDIRKTLKRLGVADNTIIVFMSDNGSPGTNPQNLPLRGHKITGWEGGTRVPLIVHWPKMVKPGTTTDTPMIIEDIFPTFLEMASVPVPANDGESFIEILKNPTTNRSERPLFWHYPNFYNQPPYSAVRLGNFKLIYWHEKGAVELYDLSKDLGERNDITAKHPERTQHLTTLLTKHLKEETKAIMPVTRESGKAIPYPSELLSR